MSQLDRWDSTEVMRITIAVDEAIRNAMFHGNLEVSSSCAGRDGAFHRRAGPDALEPGSLPRSAHRDPDRPRAGPFAIRDSVTTAPALTPRKWTAPSTPTICSAPADAGCCS